MRLYIHATAYNRSFLVEALKAVQSHIEAGLTPEDERKSTLQFCFDEGGHAPADQSVVRLGALVTGENPPAVLAGLKEISREVQAGRDELDKTASDGCFSFGVNVDLPRNGSTTLGETFAGGGAA